MSSVSKSVSKIKISDEGNRAGKRQQTNRAAQSGDLMTPRDLKTLIEDALTERFEKFARQTKTTRSRPNEKTVHDLRVAIRRLIATLDTVRTIVQKSGTAGMRKELKDHLDSLSKLRDTQVQIEKVKDLVDTHDVLAGFLQDLSLREAAQLKRARKEIEHIRPEDLRSDVEQMKKKVDTYLASSAMRETAYSIALGMLARLYSRTVVLRKEIESDPDNRIQGLHDLRLLFKRFRYSIEMLRPIFPKMSDHLQARMSEYQQRMGTIQDTAVLITAIDLYSKSKVKKVRKGRDVTAESVAAVRTHLSNNLEEAVTRFLSRAGDLDEFWEHIK